MNPDRTIARLLEEGSMHLANEQFDAAEACFKEVVGIDKRHAEGYFKLGNVAVKTKRTRLAEQYYQQAIAIDPKYAKALYNLGNLCFNQSRLEEAVDYYQRSVCADQRFVAAHINLGVALMRLGRACAAEISYRQALKYEPDSAEILSNLSVALKEQGCLEAAEAVSRNAIELDPRYANAYNNLGTILKEQNRLIDAEFAYRRALQHSPNHAEALNNLGVVLRGQGRLEQAEAMFRQAIAIRPNYISARSNLGVVLTHLVRLDDAEHEYRQLLTLVPDDPRIHNSLGGNLASQGRPAEAITCFRRALELAPDLLSAHSNLIFALNYESGVSGSSLMDEARRFGRSATRIAKHRFTFWVSPLPEERVRIGVVSADLGMHPVGYFVASWLQHMHSSRFDFYAYSANAAEDAMTARLRPFFKEWRDISLVDDEVAAHLIHTDRINILIDLSGHTTNNRLPLFVRKPAPVQATWIGYFATTGVREIDYLLATRAEIPENERHRFTEDIYYLPETRLCFAPPQFAPPVSILPALAKGRFTFGCFQNISKLSDSVLRTWARILAKLPHAELRVQAPQLTTLQAKESLYRRFEECAIDRHRATLHGPSDRNNYLAAYSEVDCILDTFPYPGGTTTCEALWMGVPTLTLAGRSMLGRQGAVLLSAATFNEWIAQDEEEYIAMAVRIASDLSHLVELRAILRERVAKSPLCDSIRFAKYLQEALWHMWVSHAHHEK